MSHYQEWMQRAFDKAYLGVLAQGKQSKTSRGCLYRGPEGLRCAIGHLIPDACYEPFMDAPETGGTAISLLLSDIRMKVALDAGGFPKAEEFREFLSDLQGAHDQGSVIDLFVEDFKDRMHLVASNWGLSIPQGPQP